MQGESACFTSGDERIDGAEQCFLIVLGELVDGLKATEEAAIERRRLLSLLESKQLVSSDLERGGQLLSMFGCGRSRPRS